MEKRRDNEGIVRSGEKKKMIRIMKDIKGENKGRCERQDNISGK